MAAFLVTGLMALGGATRQGPAVVQGAWRLPVTIEVLQDVPVINHDLPWEESGKLYLQNHSTQPFVLAKGQRFEMTAIGKEGSCRIRFQALDFGVTSCPWLEGFRDHQSDIFSVALGPADLPVTVEALRDVPIRLLGQDLNVPRGVLCFVLVTQQATVVRRGQTFQTVQLLPENGCRLRVAGENYDVMSCPWMDGSKDHQGDIFKVVATGQ